MNKKVLVTGGSGLIGSYLKDIMPSSTYVSSKDYNLLNENYELKLVTTSKLLYSSIGEVIILRLVKIIHPLKKYIFNSILK